MCGGSCLKGIYLVINIILILVGLAAIVLAAWALIDSLELLDSIWTSEFIDKPYLIRSGAYLIIALASVVIIIAVLGLIGSFKEIKCLLILYVVVFIILILGEVTVIVLAAVYKDEINESFKTSYFDKLKTTYDGVIPQSDSTNIAFDKLQQSQECCGINNYLDYASDLTVPGPQVIPEMCCVLKTNNYPTSVETKKGNCATAAPNTPTGKFDYTEQGCYSAVQVDVYEKTLVICITAGCLVFFQLLGLIFALCVCCRVKSDSDLISAAKTV